MNNNQLAQRYSEGYTEGVGSNMFIESDTIYSYGHHFPIAKKLNNNLYLFNSCGYSVTTARHKSIVRSQLNGTIIELKDCDFNKIPLQLKDNDFNIGVYQDKILRARKENIKIYYNDRINYLKSQNKKLYELSTPLIIEAL